MKQILIAMLMCIFVSIAQAQVGGILISNCPFVERDPTTNKVTCIQKVNGNFTVNLSINPDPLSYDDLPGSIIDYNVDFSSINGFVDHGIPLTSLLNGGYEINIPESGWNSTRFLFAVWLKDSSNTIVKKHSYEVRTFVCAN